MANADVVTYNVAVLVTTLFVLEFGADKFIDHAAIVVRRTGIPETIVGLLTAGGEWEELAVVIASLAHRRASLALGNVVGSAISNILGAFSLGLLCHPGGASLEFDRSSRTYTLLLLALTTTILPVIYFPRRSVWQICGALLVAFFALYIGSVAWAISRGSLTAPEDSDDDSSDTSSSDSDEIIDPTERTPLYLNGDTDVRDGSPVFGSSGHLDHVGESTEAAPTRRTGRPRRSLSYHISYLILGFLAICLSGYVLAHSATTIIDELGISDVLFGVVVLAIATTLPEKFVAIVSGSRGHVGILVANTAGSNIFLLSLCLGVVMLDTSGDLKRGSVNVAELGVLWTSTLAFTLTIWIGGRYCRWIGAVMLVGYVAFIVLEFAVIHGIAVDY
ncbi:hypothetical protein LTR84_011507 [Exophiala bonariae]|uniref:Sodium/calcium exchanger membrane region domain-containing protein n=1 Tax=Exophiala bonariae TaxID=1690606 RepID=A0AAV9NGP6_9EURO|nr:hypothetical protein LTR84_011507 [Exophiala bonariae]